MASGPRGPAWQVSLKRLDQPRLSCSDEGPPGAWVQRPDVRQAAALPGTVGDVTMPCVLDTPADLPPLPLLSAWPWKGLSPAWEEGSSGEPKDLSELGASLPRPQLLTGTS